MTLETDEEINDEFDDEEFDSSQTAGIFIQADILLRQFRDLFANSAWARFNPAAHHLDRNRLLPEHADWPGLCQHIVSLMNQPDSCEFEFARGLHTFHLAGIHWYQSEHVFCYPKDLPTEGQLAYFSPSELGKWRKPHAYKFRQFRQQAKEHGWNIPNGPTGTRMICEELLRRKNAVEESFRQIAAMRRTLERDCQMELNVSGSIGYDLFTDQFHRKSRTSHHLAQDIARANYSNPVIVGCDLGGPMDDVRLPYHSRKLRRKLGSGGKRAQPASPPRQPPAQFGVLELLRDVHRVLCASRRQHPARSGLQMALVYDAIRALPAEPEEGGL